MNPPPFKGGQGRTSRDVRAAGSFFLVWFFVLLGFVCWAIAQVVRHG